MEALRHGPLRMYRRYAALRNRAAPGSDRSNRTYLEIGIKSVLFIPGMCFRLCTGNPPQAGDGIYPDVAAGLQLANSHDVSTTTGNFAHVFGKKPAYESVTAHYGLCWWGSRGRQSGHVFGPIRENGIRHIA
jgi:hypothetical protein